MARNSLIFLSVAIAPLLALIPKSAHAFCRTTTVAIPTTYAPDQKGCWSEGVPLFWRNQCVGYSLQKAAGENIPYPVASDVMDAAFNRWAVVPCPQASADGHVSVSIRPFDNGPVACTKVEYNANASNQHVIVFRDAKWPHPGDQYNTLALTTVTFNTITGEIYDADMEVNTADQPITADGKVLPDGYDLESIITHEAGHFYGLAHSENLRATMYPQYQHGTTLMRSLSHDDVEGICAIYPPNGKRNVGTSVDKSGQIDATSCDPTPRHGFSTLCKDEQPSRKKSFLPCSAAARSPGRSVSSVAMVIASASMAAVAAMRRQRRRYAE